MERDLSCGPTAVRLQRRPPSGDQHAEHPVAEPDSVPALLRSALVSRREATGPVRREKVPGTKSDCVPGCAHAKNHPSSAESKPCGLGKGPLHGKTRRGRRDLLSEPLARRVILGGCWGLSASTGKTLANWRTPIRQDSRPAPIEQYRVNHRIRIPRVRSSARWRPDRIVDTQEVLKLARDEGLTSSRSRPKQSLPSARSWTTAASP